MTAVRQTPPTDFQPPADDLVLRDEESGPIVGRAASGRGPALAIAGFAGLALVLFLIVNGRRLQHADPEATTSLVTHAELASPPPPLELPLTPVSAPGPGPFQGLPATVSIAPPAAPTPVAPALGNGPSAIPTPVSAPDSGPRLHAPAVVVDLGGVPRELVLAQAAGGGLGVGAGGPANSAAGAGQRPQLNDSEQFAKRVGDEEPERARAVPMRNLHATAPQGTIIPGVLETAINSDLPGFTRAVVSRDVLSFDGKAVLIPRGSRLIGQYKSAVALGQSRAFIIWTRVIRPDGVSIQIGSPGTDELGRGGLEGQVDRHFFRRFSGSILLSVLNAGVAAIGRTPSTQISIGSPGAAAGLASSAVQGDAIAPTIKVAQGEAINMFVARDLDFSGVEPIR